VINISTGKKINREIINMRWN